MNDNQPWPVMGQAAASRAVKLLARHAAWRLAACAPYHGLPLAAFLHDEPYTLLVAVASGPLPPAAAAMTASLTGTRSDGIIVGAAGRRRGLPEIALGLWRRGQVAWHQPLLPWLAEDGAMWLARDDAADWRTPAYKLVARHMGADAAPWTSKSERQAGLARAAAMLARPEGEEE